MQKSFRYVERLDEGILKALPTMEKSDIQYLIYLFMAEIETIRGNKGIINI